MKVFAVFERCYGVEYDSWSDLWCIFMKEEDAKRYVDKKNEEYSEFWSSEPPFYYKEWSVK